MPEDNNLHIPFHRDDELWLSTLLSPATRVEFHTMSLYRTHPDFGFTSRVINQNVLNYVIDGGNLSAQTPGTSDTLSPGGLVWVAPGAPHSFAHDCTDNFFRMYNIRFSLHTPTGTVGFAPDMLTLTQAQDYRRLFEMMFEDRDRNHSKREERFKHWLYLLYTDLIEPRETPTGKTLDRPQRQALRHFTNARINQRITTKELAEHIGLSEDYFRRVFQRTYNKSVSQWIMHERIHHASNHLMNGANVTEAAKLMGYKDIYLFSRQFKQVMGLPPSHYAAKAPETVQLTSKPYANRPDN